MKLSTKARKSLPSKVFAGPGRSFPIPDKTHALKALQLAPYSEEKGNISPAEESRIKTKARKKLGEDSDGDEAPKMGKLKTPKKDKPINPHTMTHDQFMKL